MHTLYSQLAETLVYMHIVLLLHSHRCISLLMMSLGLYICMVRALVLSSLTQDKQDEDSSIVCMLMPSVLYVGGKMNALVIHVHIVM
jgi:hypothetical protein